MKHWRCLKKAIIDTYSIIKGNTDYARIVFDFDDGNPIEEKVENDKGYILIYNGVVNVYKDVGIDCRLLNSQ